MADPVDDGKGGKTGKNAAGQEIGPDGQPIQKKDTKAPADIKQPVLLKNTDIESFNPINPQGPLATDADVATQKRELLWDALKRRKQLTDEKEATLSPFNKSLLLNLACVENKTNGILTIFNPDASQANGQKAILDMTPYGTVGVRNNWNLDKKEELTSKDHIDALLKGAALARMANQPDGGDATKPTVKLETPNETSRMMMAYAGYLTGLRTGDANGKLFDKTYWEKLDPAIRKQMDDQWGQMRKDYEKGENFVPLVQPKVPEKKDPPANDGKLTLADVGANAEKRATAKFTGDAAPKMDDPRDVADKLEKWAETLKDSPAKAKYLEDLQKQLQGATVDPKAIVNATNDFLKTTSSAKDFKAPVSGEPGADTLENISLLTQAYASHAGVAADPKLYRTFQPGDSTPAEKLPDLTTAPPVTGPENKPVPAAAPK
jgi:hypothetical protein